MWHKGYASAHRGPMSTLTATTEPLRAIADPIGVSFPGTQASVCIEDRDHCGAPAGSRYVSLVADAGRTDPYGEAEPEVVLTGYLMDSGWAREFTLTLQWDDPLYGYSTVRLPDQDVADLAANFADHTREAIIQSARQRVVNAEVNTPIAAAGSGGRLMVQVRGPVLAVCSPGGAVLAEFNMDRKQSRWAPRVRPQGLSGLVSVSADDRDQVVRQTGRELLLAQDRFADLTDASAGKRYLDGLIEQVRAAPTIRG